MTTSVRAGVIGLGEIGGGVAVSMARRGRVPSVYDVRPDAAAQLEGVPAQLDSIAAVTRNSDVVLIAVVSADQARDVLVGSDGLLAAARPGLIVVLLSTVSVTELHELAELCRDADVILLDCGVTNGDKAAENGIIAMIGGPDEQVDRARPVLDDFASAIMHCGPVGAGMATKIARNLIQYGCWSVVDEAANLVAAQGVSLNTLLSVMREADSDGKQTLRLLDVRAAGITVPSDYADRVAALANKDLDAAADLGVASGVPTPLARAIKPTMRDVYTGHRA
ncbi:NAD(P)-dependent oxidoreductase [Mycobacterium vicinigordonae]|uniref:NAD(P)-dependent oxidoreductase n=1 Tax=Mycobacterium vicinigordonae TaxID=1719132 RepID=UPI001BB363EE|nr:NAD(P)-dependent oxidoreductase [Mycobacterium vicinigordonae]